MVRTEGHGLVQQGIFLLCLKYQRSTRGCSSSAVLSRTAVANQARNHVVLGTEEKGSTGCKKSMCKALQCEKIKLKRVFFCPHLFFFYQIVDHPSKAQQMKHKWLWQMRRQGKKKTIFLPVVPAQQNRHSWLNESFNLEYVSKYFLGQTNFPQNLMQTRETESFD